MRNVVGKDGRNLNTGKLKKYAKIIEQLEALPDRSPPPGLKGSVMTRLEEKAERQSPGNYHDVFELRRKKSDGWTTIFDPVTTIDQCVVIYLAVGFFYCVAGSVTILGLSGILSSFEIPVWLKLQPWLAMASGILILISAFLMHRQPGLIRYIQLAMFFHTALIFVNALFLQLIVSFSGAMLYIFILTMAAMVFGVLLLGAVRSVTSHLVVEETHL